MARTFWCPRILPKNERTKSSKSEFVCLFFRRIRGYQKSFRNYLTFNNIIVHFYKYQPAIVWGMGLKPRKAQNQYNSYLKLNSSLFFCQINMSFIARKTKKIKNAALKKFQFGYGLCSNMLHIQIGISWVSSISG